MSKAELNIKLLSAITVQAPDGGWGWMIVLGAFLNNAVVDGIVFTVGQGFQPVWEKYYNVNSGTAAWVVSLLIFMYYISGPIVSVFANKWGCRPVVIVGSIIAALGFIMSRYASSITALYVTFGIFGGIGLGFIFLPSNIVMSYWFTKRRATATGIGLCGTGVGTFAFAPLISLLLTNFCWEDALLIIAGLALNCIIFGCLYRPLEPTREQIRNASLKLNAIHCEDVPEIEENTELSRSRLSMFQRTTFRPRVATEMAVHRSLLELVARKRSQSICHVGDARLLTKEKIIRMNGPLSRMDIMYQGSVQQIQPISNIRVVNSNVNDPTGVGGNINDVIDTLRDILSVDLFYSPTFLLLAMSGFFTVAGMYVPLIYLPRCVLTKGISEIKATSLISIIGVTNIVARIVAGWLSDRPNVDALWINNIAIMLGGVATVFVPHMQSYWLLVCYSVLFGITIACFAGLRTIIAVELLGLERLTNVFGLLLLFMGFASLIGSPIAGTLLDITGDYKLSFYVAGGFIFLSGLICAPLKRIKSWEITRGESKPKPFEKSSC